MTYSKKIEKIKQQIETGDPLLFALLFIRHNLYWKKRIRKDWRLIAKLVSLGQDKILYLSCLLHRSSHEYHDFLDNQQTWGDHKIETQIDINELKRWLEDHQELEINEPLIIPTNLLSWLKKPTLLRKHNTIIFESREWVEPWQIKDSEIVANKNKFDSIIEY